MKSKDTSIIFRVSHEEKSKIEKAAEECGLSMSSFIKQRTLNEYKSIDQVKPKILNLICDLSYEMNYLKTFYTLRDEDVSNIKKIEGMCNEIWQFLR